MSNLYNEWGIIMLTGRHGLFIDFCMFKQLSLTLMESAHGQQNMLICKQLPQRLSTPLILNIRRNTSTLRDGYCNGTMSYNDP